MRLKAEHTAILVNLANGATLKCHRGIDGDKVHKLHFLDGSTELPLTKTVEHLKRTGYIYSNKKFPAATYFLTPQGHRAVASVVTR